MCWRKDDWWTCALLTVFSNRWTIIIKRKTRKIEISNDWTFYLTLTKIMNKKTYISYATLSSATPWDIPRKFKWQVVYSTVWHEGALDIYFIPCHRKYSAHHHQCDMRAAHDEKVGWKTVKFTAASCILIGCVFCNRNCINLIIAYNLIKQLPTTAASQPAN